MNFISKYILFLFPAVLMVGCGRTLEIPSRLEIGRVDSLTWEAVDNTRAYLLANPKDPSAWANLGMVLFDGGLAIEARKCFENAKYLAPNNPRYVYLLGWAFLPDGPGSALVHLQNAYRLSTRFDPDNPAPAIRLAETLRALGNDLEAKNILGDLQKRAGKHPVASLMLAEIATSQGDDKEALSILSEIPDVIFLTKRKRLLELVLRFGENSGLDYSKKMEEVRLLPQDSDWPDPYLLENKPEWLGLRGSFRLAEALEGKGRLDEAASLLQKIWDKTGDVRSQVGLVGCYIGMGKWEEAKRTIELQAQSPHNPVLWARYYLTYGDQLVTKGKEDQARRHFITGLKKLGYNYQEGDGLEALGLRCRLLWRLESWRELVEAASLYNDKNPFHRGAKVFLCLSRMRLNQTEDDCDLNILAKITNTEVFPETEQILRLIAKTVPNRSIQGKFQP